MFARAQDLPLAAGGFGRGLPCALQIHVVATGFSDLQDGVQLSLRVTIVVEDDRDPVGSLGKLEVLGPVVLVWVVDGVVVVEDNLGFGSFLVMNLGLHLGDLVDLGNVAIHVSKFDPVRERSLQPGSSPNDEGSQSNKSNQAGHSLAFFVGFIIFERTVSWFQVVFFGGVLGIGHTKVSLFFEVGSTSLVEWQRVLRSGSLPTTTPTHQQNVHETRGLVAIIPEVISLVSNKQGEREKNPSRRPRANEVHG